MPPGINFFAFSLTGAKDVSPSLAILTTNVPLDHERRKTKEETKKERRRLLGITAHDVVGSWSIMSESPPRKVATHYVRWAT